VTIIKAQVQSKAWWDSGNDTKARGGGVLSLGSINLDNKLYRFTTTGNSVVGEPFVNKNNRSTLPDQETQGKSTKKKKVAGET